MIDECVRIVRQRRVAEELYVAALAAPAIAAEAVAGQFVQVRVSDGYTPLLRLPLSIADADPESGRIELVYERIGPKTATLAACGVGVELRCLGPLGRGFAHPAGHGAALLVGGGIGLPPLLFLGRRLQTSGHHVALLAGARTAAKHLPCEYLAPAAERIVRSTDDGTLGRPGLVTDLLDGELKSWLPQNVFTCGPYAMMRAVASACTTHGIPCQVSLEEYMACGIGICAGCVVPLRESDHYAGGEYGRYARVCVSGPVFDADAIDWRDR